MNALVSRRTVLGATTLALLTACGHDPSSPSRAARSSQEVTVALQAQEHLPLVEARVNGAGPYRFAVDSGSAATLRVSPALGRRLPKVGQAREGDPSGQGEREVPVVRVDTFSLGGTTFTDVEASVGAGRGGLATDGIIGLSLFAGSVTVDYPRSVLRLSPSTVEPGPHTVPFSDARGVPRIEVEAGGVRLDVDVDTGGPGVLTVPTRTSVPLVGRPVRGGTGRTPMGEFEVLTAPLDGDLVVAGFSIANPRVDIVEHLPFASLGAGFLRTYAVTFDLASACLRLSR